VFDLSCLYSKEDLLTISVLTRGLDAHFERCRLLGFQSPSVLLTLRREIDELRLANQLASQLLEYIQNQLQFEQSDGNANINKNQAEKKRKFQVQVDVILIQYPLFSLY